MTDIWKYNALIRKVCLYEIRLAQGFALGRSGPPNPSDDNYRAKLITHAPGGPREIIDRLYFPHDDDDAL
jgi:hypothetical protein